MAGGRRPGGIFFMWFGLIEGTAILLAISAYFFMHHNMAYLIGSIVMIALVSSTYLLPRVLMSQGQKDWEESDN